ncbi:MAG: hypothetical protein SH817_08680 [Leptospira sp.]|nr:hypothetical protein [Leptospira sp.]
MSNSKLKISSVVTQKKAISLRPDPKNAARPPRTPEQKEEWRSFCESVWKNGIWGDKPLLVYKDKKSGKLLILRGRRRWTAVIEGIKKKKLPKNFMVPVVFLESDYDSTYREAIYGDNDTNQRYWPEERQEIMIREWGIPALIKNYKGGDYTSGKAETDPRNLRKAIRHVIHEAIPQWTLYQIDRDLEAIKKANKNEKYPELTDDQIQSYNKQILSWWERVNILRKIEKEKEDELKKFIKREENAKKEIADFAKGFPKGGPELYAKIALKSKRSEFQVLKKIKGLDEYIGES